MKTILLTLIIFSQVSLSHAQINKPLKNPHKFYQEDILKSAPSYKKSTIPLGEENEYGNPPVFKWVKKFESYGSSSINSFVYAKSNMVYLCGYYVGQQSIGNTVIESKGFYDGFVVKSDLSGNPEWVLNIETTKAGAVSCLDIQLDEMENVYVTGHFESDTLKVGDYTLNKIGLNDIFLIKIDKMGNVVFLSGYGTNQGTHVGNELHLDSEGNIFVLDTNGYRIIKFSQSGSIINELPLNCTNLADFCIVNDKLYIIGTGVVEEGLTKHLSDQNYNPFIFVIDAGFNSSNLYPFIGTGYNSLFSIEYNVVNQSFYFTGLVYNTVFFFPYEINKVSRDYNFFIVKWNETEGVSMVLDPGMLIEGTAPTSMTNNYLNKISIMPDGNIIGSGYHTGSFPVSYNQFLHNSEYFLWHLDVDLAPLDFLPVNYPLHSLSPINNNAVMISGISGNAGKLSSISMQGAEEEIFNTNAMTGISYSIGACSDHEKNLYLMGYSTLNSQIANNKKDLFVTKFNSNGDLIWSVNIPGGNYWSTPGNFICLDNSGNIYGTGKLTSSMFSGIEIWENDGNYDPYFFKINPNGIIEWVKRIETTTTLIDVYSVSCDSMGNLIISGEYSEGELQYESKKLDPLSNSTNLFILKTDTHGEPIWLKGFGGESYDYLGLTVTDKDNNIYFTGEFVSRNILLDGNLYTLTDNDGDVLLVKLDSNGEIQWVNNYGSGERVRCWPFALNRSENGDIYISGWMGKNNWFGNFQLTGTSLYNFFVMKVNSTGDVQWANIVEKEYTSDFMSFNIGLDKTGNCYIGGNNRSGIKIGDHLLANYSQTKNIFFLKYDPDGQIEWIKDELQFKPNLRTTTNNYSSALCVLDEDEIFVGGYCNYGLQLDELEIIGSNLSFGYFGLIAPLNTSSEQINTNNSEFPSAIFYPNPAEDFINYKTSISLKNSRIDIYNMQGIKVISETDGISSKGKIDISQLLPGLYVITYSNEQSRVVHSFIKR